MRTLIENGAEINAKQNDGRTPLDRATINGNILKIYTQNLVPLNWTEYAVLFFRSWKSLNQGKSIDLNEYFLININMISNEWILFHCRPQRCCQHSERSWRKIGGINANWCLKAPECLMEYVHDFIIAVPVFEQKSHIILFETCMIRIHNKIHYVTKWTCANSKNYSDWKCLWNKMFKFS